MSSVLTPTLPVASVVPHTPVTAVRTPGPEPLRFTIEQYRALGALPEFQGLRTMLLHGEIFAMVMPNPPHDVVLGMIDDWLRTVFTSDYHVRCQMGFDIGTKSDPGPDLAVVRGSRKDYLEHTPTEAVLVVEVAESSLFLDTTTKAELYATAGVRDYWVLDVSGRRLLVFRDPEPLPKGQGATAYRTHMAFGSDDSIAPLAAPGSAVRIAELLP